MKRILDAFCGSRMFWFDKANSETIYDTFYHVVFDPLHLLKVGESSWLAKKYGKLDPLTWKEDIRLGFDECMRVLKPNGTLVFKWNEDQISLKEILKIIEQKPLYGNKRAKTHWLIFIK